MNCQTTEQKEPAQQIETVACDQCRKWWQVGWIEAGGGDSFEHPVTCDCGLVLKVVCAGGDHPPLIIPQHPWGKTLTACLLAFAGGALFRVLPEPALLTLYMIAWTACSLTFIDEDNSDFSALIGIALWSLAILSAASGVGALAAHLILRVGELLGF
jgi:hypothetical protein